MAIAAPRYPRNTLNAYELSFEDVARTLDSWGEPSYRARQVFDGLWRRAATYEELTDLPRGLRDRLAEELPARLEVLTERDADDGATRKALLRLGEEHIVEAVLMAYHDRMTVCVSSQAGCAMGCGFCATGQMGLLNNLTSGEIASQVVWARRAARAARPGVEKPLTNVVFMGMGEPMANYRHTRDAVSRLLDPAGLDLAARHVTVSTVGVVPGIRRLAEDHPQVGLAVSLHAADDDLRSELVPVNRLWPLAELERAVEEWREATHRRPSIEWTLIDGVNDDDRQARLLGPLARRMRAHVNLIPMNPTPHSEFRPSPPDRVARFADAVRAGGAPVTVRDTRGREIEAACGQLHWDAATASQHPVGDRELPEREVLEAAAR
jgi:23S rRNA (adenine2503-C2)-methyltransferase